MGLAVQTIAAAEARFGAFDAAVGHSFGGAALMVSAAGMLPESPARFRRKDRDDRLAERDEMAVYRLRQNDSGSGKALRPCSRARSIVVPAAARGVRCGKGRRNDGAACARDPCRGRQGGQRHSCAALCSLGGSVRLFWANGFGHRRIVSAEPVLSEIQRFLADDPIKKDAEIIPLFELPAKQASL